MCFYTYLQTPIWVEAKWGVGCVKFYIYDSNRGKSYLAWKGVMFSMFYLKNKYWTTLCQHGSLQAAYVDILFAVPRKKIIILGNVTKLFSSPDPRKTSQTHSFGRWISAATPLQWPPFSGLAFSRTISPVEMEQTARWKGKKKSRVLVPWKGKARDGVRMPAQWALL